MSTYSSILAVLAGAEGDAEVLGAAGRLAGASGQVRVVAVRSDPARVLPIVGEAGAAAAADLVAVLEQQSRARTARARAAFEGWRDRAGLAMTEFTEPLGHPSETAALAARNCDILVLARPQGAEEPAALGLAEACLFGSGRPLLLAGPGAAGGFGSSIAVLWDGSRTAARAVGDAMPLLSKARSVLVLTSGQVAEELPTGADLAARLKMQGIAAEARSVKSGDGEGPALARAAAEAGCDLLVMGGYGHSRLREMIIGGVTRYMLSSVPIPVLMAH